MAWPTTGAGSLATGYLGTGVTTIVWGTKDLVVNVGGITTPFSTDGKGVVTRFVQRPLAENIKLTNGDGLTTTRIQIVDGGQWEITIRDDTGFTVRPKIGNTVEIYDGAGFLLGAQAVGTPASSLGAGGTPRSFIATVVEASYEVTPKNPAEFTITVENLILIAESLVNTA